MGWFDDQIEFRKKHEREILSDSIENIARSVTGRRIGSALKAEADVNDAVSALLKHMGIREREVPANVKGLQDKLDYLLSSTGILYREIILKKGWHGENPGKCSGLSKPFLPAWERGSRCFWATTRITCFPNSFR